MRPLWFVLAIAILSAQGARAYSRACASCGPEFETRVKSVTEEFTVDIHAQKKMSCETCHGSSPNGMPTARSYYIPRARIPELCGSCHADAARIKQFNPSLRTDQLAQYRTSVHGIKFAHGDTRVAVCTDCHFTHIIRPSSDPESSVHPMNVAVTCKRCHSDANYMRPYHIETNQFADYSQSVHSEAVVMRGDLTAPTCTTCHGSHGAVLPGVKNVANVCAACHVFQGKFYEESPHKQVFARMGLADCVACHTSHGIRHPTDDFVGTGKDAVCGTCHDPGDSAGRVADGIHGRLRQLEIDIANAKSRLDRAEHSGMDVADAQLELTQANDALTKARVTLHTAKLSRVAADTDAGTKIAIDASAAGEAALKERGSRRKALLFPLIAIAALVASLCGYIREIEGGS